MPSIAAMRFGTVDLPTPGGPYSTRLRLPRRKLLRTASARSTVPWSSTNQRRRRPAAAIAMP